MRLILTWQRWALIDIEVLLAQRIQDKNAEEETMTDEIVDLNEIPFGFTP